MSPKRSSVALWMAPNLTKNKFSSTWISDRLISQESLSPSSPRFTNNTIPAWTLFLYWTSKLKTTTMISMCHLTRGRSSSKMKRKSLSICGSNWTNSMKTSSVQKLMIFNLWDQLSSKHSYQRVNNNSGSRKRDLFLKLLKEWKVVNNQMRRKI